MDSASGGLRRSPRDAVRRKALGGSRATIRVGASFTLVAALAVLSGCTGSGSDAPNNATPASGPAAELVSVLRSGIGQTPQAPAAWLPTAPPNLLEMASAVFVLGHVGESVPPPRVAALESMASSAWSGDHAHSGDVPDLALTAAVVDASSAIGRWPAKQTPTPGDGGVALWLEKHRSKNISRQDALAAERLQQSLELASGTTPEATHTPCAATFRAAGDVIWARWKEPVAEAGCVLDQDSAQHVTAEARALQTEFNSPESDQSQALGRFWTTWSAARFSLDAYPALRTAVLDTFDTLDRLGASDQLERHPAALRDYVTLSLLQHRPARLGPAARAVLHETAINGSARELWTGMEAYSYVAGALRLLGASSPTDVLATRDPLQRLNLLLLADPTRLDADLLQQAASALLTKGAIADLSPRQAGQLAQAAVIVEAPCEGTLAQILQAQASLLGAADPKEVAKSATRTVAALNVLRAAQGCAPTAAQAHTSYDNLVRAIPTSTPDGDNAPVEAAAAHAQALCLVAPERAAQIYTRDSISRLVNAPDGQPTVRTDVTPAEAYAQAYLVRVAAGSCP